MKNDIVEVISEYAQIKRQNQNSFWCLCPFHGEKTPSFSIKRDKQFFRCFGCGVGGDVIKFIERKENLDFIDAVKFLANRAGMSLPEVSKSEYGISKRIIEANKEAARFYNGLLFEQVGKRAAEYLDERQIAPNIRKRFGLGYSPGEWDVLFKFLTEKGFSREEMRIAGLIRINEKGVVHDFFRNRVMFPIIDIRGQVIGFGGRIMGDGQPKYLNTLDNPVFTKRNHLYAMNFAKNFCSENIILAEGYMDAISLHQAGFKNAVATLGTSLTEEQAKLMSRYTKEAVIAYDSDEAGKKASVRAIDILNKSYLKVRILTLNGAKDPDEYIKLFGRDKLKQSIQNSIGHIEYKINELRIKYNPDIPEQKVEFLTKAAELYAGISNSIERDVYIERLSNEISFSKDALLTEVMKIQKKQNKNNSTIKDITATTVRRDRSNAVPLDRAPQKIRRAEEGLLTLLLENPDFYSKTDEITSSDFSVELYGRMFGIISERLEKGESITLPIMGREFTDDEMAQITAFLSLETVHENILAEFDDYIRVIKNNRQKLQKENIDKMDAESLDQYVKNIAIKKQGGTING